MIGNIIPTPKSIKKISGKFELKDIFNISFNDNEFTKYSEALPNNFL